MNNKNTDEVGNFLNLNLVKKLITEVMTKTFGYDLFTVAAGCQSTIDTIYVVAFEGQWSWCWLS